MFSIIEASSICVGGVPGLVAFWCYIRGSQEALRLLCNYYIPLGVVLPHLPCEIFRAYLIDVYRFSVPSPRKFRQSLPDFSQF